MADFYLVAAKVLDAVLSRQTSLKAAVTNESASYDRRVQPKHSSHPKAPLAVPPPSRNRVEPKRLLAAVSNTLAYRNVLDHVLKAAGVIQAEESRGKGARQKGFRSIKPYKGKSSTSSTTSSWEYHDDGNLHSSSKDTASKKWSTPKEQERDRSLLLLLTHDLLFQPKGISASSTWPPRMALEAHKTRLKAELTRYMIKAGVKNVQHLRIGAEQQRLRDRTPRWVRLNTRVQEEDKIREALEKEGWTLVDDVRLSKGKTYASSSHIPHLYLFHPSSTSSLLSSPLYTSGSLILQDLASCIPAHVLLSDDPMLKKDGKAKHIVDATAAPGNKTSHLSAILGEMQRESKITAFEHSPARFKTLVSQLSKHACLPNLSSIDDVRSGGSKSTKSKPTTLKSGSKSNNGRGQVHPIQADFLETDPEAEEWRNVTHMLLDPSCSGSGILGRGDALLDGDGDGDGGGFDELEDTNDLSEQDTKPLPLDGVQDVDLKGKPGAPHPSIPLPTPLGRKNKSLAGRLRGLAEFQTNMILHALKFPSLTRLVYSTCSIHAEENENVIKAVLASPLARKRGWQLAGREEVLGSWETRGLEGFVKGEGGRDLGDSMIRCQPGGDPLRVLGAKQGDATAVSASAPPSAPNPGAKPEGDGDVGGQDLEEGQCHAEASQGFFVACLVRRKGIGGGGGDKRKNGAGSSGGSGEGKRKRDGEGEDGDEMEGKDEEDSIEVEVKVPSEKVRANEAIVQIQGEGDSSTSDPNHVDLTEAQERRRKAKNRRAKERERAKKRARKEGHGMGEGEGEEGERVEEEEGEE